MRVVSNTSPLILLAKIGRLELLRLYAEVVIPHSVLTEIRAKPGRESDSIESFLQSRYVQHRTASTQTLHRIPEELGAGERAAIAVALDVNADLVLVDDLQGRQAARDKGLAVSGTIGVLIEARAGGMIALLQPELDRLVEAGMWIGEPFYHRLLQEFDE